MQGVWPGRTGSAAVDRLRALAVVAAALTVLLAVVLAIAFGSVAAGFHTMAAVAAPEVVAGTDLNVSLSDLDAQAANVLLVGADTGLSDNRAHALARYESDRTRIDADLRTIATVGGGDPAVAAAVQAVLDDIGRYQSYAGTALWLNGNGNDPVGTPSAAALANYRQATALMATALRDAGTLLSREEVSAHNADQAATTGTVWARVWVLVLGVALVAALVLTQVHLRMRWRRRISPPLLAATALALAATITATVLLTAESSYLSTAEHGGFDQVVSLSQARAAIRETAADESRYLVDPAHAASYQQAFQDRSQEVLSLPGTDIAHYDDRLRSVLNAYYANNADVAFGGYLGAALHNVGSYPERLLVQRVIARFQGYEVADRMMRATLASGDVRDAVEFDTGTALGYSSYNLDYFDQALGLLIQQKQGVFDDAVASGNGTLAGWTWPIPTGIAVLVLVGLALGAWPRLSEYR